MGRRGVFCHDAPLLPLSLDRFPQKFPRTRIQVVARDTWFHIPEKFPLRDRICRKTIFLGYPICDQPMGHGERSATPTLFPSHSGHPTDVPWVTFAKGCTVFQLSTSESVLISNGHTWMWTQSRHLARGVTLNRPIIFSNITRQVAPPDRRYAVV